MFDVSGKRAIVTGGAQGIGFEITLSLLKRGCSVCIADIDDKKGHEAKVNLQKEFGCKDVKIHFIKFDVADKNGWNTMWDEAEKVLCGKIEILANNAGIHPLHGWEKCLDVMSTGSTCGVFTAWERMSTKKGGTGGRIINTASTLGIVNIPIGDLSSVGYNISKAGIIALTSFIPKLDEDSFKAEGVKCYTLAPHLVDTNLIKIHLEIAAKTGNYPVVNNKRILKIDDFHQAGLMRKLNVQEVGDAFMLALKEDKNGAVYSIMPDLPLLEFPCESASHVFAGLVMTSKIGSLFGLKVFKPFHFYASVGIILSLAFVAFHILLLYIF